MLNDTENIFFLNSNGSGPSYLAVGHAQSISMDIVDGGFTKAQAFINANKDSYIFGWFSYDMKNDLENLTSKSKSHVTLPEIFLFVPENLAQIDASGILTKLTGDRKKLHKIYTELNNKKDLARGNDFEIHSKVNRDEYIKNVTKLKNHIQNGDIYELNYCYEFIGTNVNLDPIQFYQNLNKKTLAPFSVFAKQKDKYILSASPERFIKKTGGKVISQPIKGTVKRGANHIEDELLKTQLQNNPKERSENIMIVDLVRNDLSKIALPSSVQVTELCQIHTFKNIHQMISTVEANVGNTESIDVIKALFPMGSMTGAPKIRAMELIEQYESSKRGLYSGCIGYFSPNGDFDFNVMIRTLLYDETSKNISFSVGGAITDKSDPQGEYEETLLKADAIIKALSYGND